MFFSDEVGMVFKPWGFLHYMLFLYVIGGSVLIYLFSERLRQFPHERRVAQSMAALALLLELSLYIWHLGNGHTDWAKILPIGLCGFTLYLGIISLFFKNKTLFEIGYFWTGGAIASVLFPDISHSLDRFRFYQFQLGHMIIFFMYLYMIFVYRWYPTWRSWRKSLGTLIPISVLLIIISNLTQKNLMFMLRSDGTPLEIFEGYGYAIYLLGTISLSIAIITIWYIPFIFVHRSLGKSLNRA